MRSVDKGCLCEPRDDAVGVAAAAVAAASARAEIIPSAAFFSIPPLRVPLHSVGSVADLAAGFRLAEVSVCCAGAAALARRSGLIEKLRGALGVSLYETASPAVKAGGGCTWSPPCAAQVLWHPQGEVRPGFKVPSPIVLMADTQGDDLWLTARLFGIAGDYLGEVGDAVVRALARGLSGVAPGGLAVSDRTFRSVEGVDIPGIRAQARLRFLTPLHIRGQNADSPVTPGAFLRGLVHRVDGMSRWQGAFLTKEYAVALIDATAAVDVKWKEAAQHAWRRGAVQQGRVVPMRGATGTLYLRGGLEPFAALIAIGETTFAGSRTTFGQGRYVIGHAL